MITLSFPGCLPHTGATMNSKSRDPTGLWCAPPCFTTAAGFATKRVHSSIPTAERPQTTEKFPTDRAQLEAFEWAGDWLSAIDTYAGLMIAKHRTGLWQGRYGVIKHPVAIQRGKLPPEIEAFTARSEAKQKSAAEKFNPDELAINYNLLQVWDMMSLYICSTELLKPDRIEPVPVSYTGQEGVALTLVPMEMHTIALNPYPFDQLSLTANVIFRRLTQAKFKDSAELQSAYFKTAPQITSFRLVPSGALQ